MRPTSRLHRLPLRAMTDMITDGQFVAAGPPGGSPYALEQEALLFDSIETGWPIGHLIVWTPRGMSAGPWHVLDGHRRLHALTHAAVHVPVRLVRDLTNNAPQYRPVDAGIPDTGSIPSRRCCGNCRSCVSPGGCHGTSPPAPTPSPGGSCRPASTWSCSTAAA